MYQGIQHKSQIIKILRYTMNNIRKCKQNLFIYLAKINRVFMYDIIKAEGTIEKATCQQNENTYSRIFSLSFLPILF